MNTQFECVKEFHKKFSCPIADKPVVLDYKESQRRYLFMQEEIVEFLSASDIYGQADAMIDLIYFALGTLVEMGLPPDKMFEIVHKANMSKLWEDGKAHYNELGKVIKSDKWVDPAPLMKEYIDSLAQPIEQI